jgi:hypothetical protein
LVLDVGPFGLRFALEAAAVDGLFAEARGEAVDEGGQRAGAFEVALVVEQDVLALGEWGVARGLERDGAGGGS